MAPKNHIDKVRMESLLFKLKIYSYKFDHANRLIITQDVDWNGLELREIPFPIHECRGNFNVRGNHLKNLHNSPRIVKGHFDCSYNELTTLEGAPESVGTMFNCSVNVHLSSFEHAPRQVGTYFDGSKNPSVGSTLGASIAPHGDLSETRIPEEEIAVYLSCIKNHTWEPEFPILENLQILLKRVPKVFVQQKWHIFESLPADFRGSLLSKKLGII